MSEVKKKIIVLSVFLAVLLAFVITLICLFKQKKESERLLKNYKIEATARYEYQQEITKKELKEIHTKYDKLLKDYNIKRKNVENIVEIEYRYVDSTLYKDSLIYVYDTITKYNVAEFSIGGDCWNLSGYITDNNIITKDFDYSDSIVIYLYKEKKKCLFDKRSIKAIAISACTNDTLTILRNLKVVR